MERSVKILAIETSGQVAGCALYDDGSITAVCSVQNKKTHSQSLMPMMEEMKKRMDLDLSSIDAIALTAGPGSFTGLRIGAATAKGLGLALDKPILPVPTVDALAYNLYGAKALVCPLMDARRQQVYTGIYQFDRMEGNGAGNSTSCGGYEMHILRPQCAVSLEEIAESLNALGQEVIFLGDGVPVYADLLQLLMKVPYSFAPAHLSRQRAETTAALAANRYEREGEKAFVSADAFRPEYLRLSQAERERAAGIDTSQTRKI